MHKHYLHFFSLSLLSHSPSHLKHELLSHFGELPFFRAFSNLNRRWMGIWILLCLIKGRNLKLSSHVSLPGVCQQPCL